jgi:hypothetical protein
MNDATDSTPTVVPQKPVVQHTNSLHARVMRKKFNLTARQYKKQRIARLVSLAEQGKIGHRNIIATKESK